MKKKFPKLLAIVAVSALVAIFMSFNASAETVASGTCGADGDNLTWTLDSEGTLTISGEGEMADYDMDTWSTPWVLPALNNSISIKKVVIETGVTSIGRYAFFDSEELTEVVISGSVKKIDHFAFGFCTALEEIHIPEGVETILSHNFYGCDNLKTVTLPASLTTLEDRVFNMCEKIVVAEDNPNFSSDENGVLFNKDKTTLIKYTTARNASTYTIPTSVKAISPEAFNCSEFLTEIVIPENVETVGSHAFAVCDLLTKVTVTNKNTVLDNIFSSYENLVLCGYTGSTAQACAEANGIKFEAIDDTSVIAPAMPSGVSITLPNFKVTLGGRVMDNEYAKYPLIVYKGITYFPMTYFDSRLLGLETAFTMETGLEIKPLATAAPEYQCETLAAPNLSGYDTATVATGRIVVNGKEINNAAEEYPLLLFREITYFPLTWRFAVEEFGWAYNFDFTNGLVIGKAS